jgi:predicted esterase
MRGLLPLVGVVACSSAAWGQSLFDVGKERAQRAVVTLGERPPELAGKDGSLECEMSRVLKGVLADLRGKPLDDLRSTLPASPMLGDASGGERVCTIWLYAGTASKAVDVIHAKAAYIAVEKAEHPRRGELRADKFAAELGSWPLYRGGFDDFSEPRGEVFELTKPYTAGRFTLDQKTLGDRYLKGAKTNLEAADRVLENEKLWCRLPRGYDPKTPAGLLIWIDPSSSGRTPPMFQGALDELGLVFVGAADAGNNRLVTNREQLAFDGLATVSRRYHIDPRRVYLTGVSGGGRVSSMMLGGFPDVFTGAVPIVGLACYEPVPNGMGQFWPRAYVKPGSELFKQFCSRRMGAITGTRDFNEVEMQHATNIMRRDGVNVRLYDYDHMGHEMPHGRAVQRRNQMGG